MYLFFRLANFFIAVQDWNFSHLRSNFILPMRAESFTRNFCFLHDFTLNKGSGLAINKIDSLPNFLGDTSINYYPPITTYPPILNQFGYRRAEGSQPPNNSTTIMYSPQTVKIFLPSKIAWLMNIVYRSIEKLWDLILTFIIVYYVTSKYSIILFTYVPRLLE